MNTFVLKSYQNEHGKSVSKQLDAVKAELNDATRGCFHKQVWEDLFVANAAEHYRFVGEDHFEDYGDGACDLCDHDIKTVCYAELIPGASPFSHYDPELDLRITWPQELRLGSVCITQCGLNCDNRMFVISCFAQGKCPSFRLDNENRCPMDILCDNWVNWVNDRLAVPLSVFSVDKYRWDRWVGQGYWRMRNPFVPHHKGQRLLYRSCKSDKGTYRGVHHFETWGEAASTPLNQLYIVLTRKRAERYSNED